MKSNFEKLKDVITELRHPVTGCPWDLKQTHESLLKYLLEESYEFIEAVEEKDPKKMEEEIGDVLLQVLLHSYMASQKVSLILNQYPRHLLKSLFDAIPMFLKIRTLRSQLSKSSSIGKKLKMKRRPESLAKLAITA